MEAVFSERLGIQLSNNQSKDQDKTYSRLISRKTSKMPNNVFKKRKDESETDAIRRDKRYHSSQALRFVKSTSTQAKQTIINPERRNQDTAEEQKNFIKLSAMEKFITKQANRTTLVFNKFSKQQKDDVCQSLTTLKNSLDQTGILIQFSQVIEQVECYISKLQDNNSKLLEVNYFFQKQFNERLTEKQASKRPERCNKNYCLECRYHLEKENRWKQEKEELTESLKKLKEHLSTLNNSKQDEAGNHSSILLESARSNEDQNVLPRDRAELLLKQRLQQKDQEYLILLKQFNYIDKLNKDLKDKISKVMQEYRYLSIENRTLLNTKTRLIQRELECVKVKNQRDYFKKKAIGNHRRDGEKTRPKQIQEKNCVCKIVKSQSRQQSIFSLSSQSTEHNPSFPVLQ